MWLSNQQLVNATVCFHTWHIHPQTTLPYLSSLPHLLQETFSLIYFCQCVFCDLICYLWGFHHCCYLGVQGRLCGSWIQSISQSRFSTALCLEVGVGPHSTSYPCVCISECISSPSYMIIWVPSQYFASWDPSSLLQFPLVPLFANTCQSCLPLLILLWLFWQFHTILGALCTLCDHPSHKVACARQLPTPQTSQQAPPGTAQDQGDGCGGRCQGKVPLWQQCINSGVQHWAGAVLTERTRNHDLHQWLVRQVGKNRCSYTVLKVCSFSCFPASLRPAQAWSSGF